MVEELAPLLIRTVAEKELVRWVRSPFVVVVREFAFLTSAIDRFVFLYKRFSCHRCNSLFAAK